MSKQFVLMRDVISKFHPDFVNNTALINFALKKPHMFNVEHLIEECLADVGGYNFVDEAGRDFDDKWNSDSKTVSVVKDGLSKTAMINSVETKIGSLRITIYNPFKQTVDFMYLPKKALNLLKEPNYGKNCFKERLRIRWSEKTDYYNKFEQFRVNSFYKLATIQG